MAHARALSCLAALLTLAGCTVNSKPTVAAPAVLEAAPPPSKADRWLAVATAEDIDRLRRLPTAWSEGLRDARAGRFAAGIRDEGDLLQSSGALARPAPTPGSYYCRLVRLGKTDRTSPALAKFKPFFCYVEVEDDLLTIVKQTGTERPAGRLWEDDEANRLIFLGTLAIGAEAKVKAYGQDRTRDMAGVLERIGPMRWRLLIPYPRSGAKLDVYELTPVALQPGR